jgi:hypothetical protein
VDRSEAARLLGVAPTATPAEARAAFRDLIRTRHPDRAGAGATVDAALLIEAHRTLRTAAAPVPSAPPPPPTPAPRSTGPVDARAVGDSLLVAADAATVMARVVEAGHALGEITYLDRSSGFVEVLLLVQEDDDDRPVAVSLVASLQGRLDAVEVFCTVERLDGHPAPPIAPIVEALAAAMRS